MVCEQLIYEKNAFLKWGGGKKLFLALTSRRLAEA
jgi:hypothetical protein